MAIPEKRYIFAANNLSIPMKHLFLLFLLTPLLVLAQRADWMGELPDSAYLSELSVPGSHDTGTGYEFESVFLQAFSQTQTLTIDEQLARGIRAFDFRPRATGGTLKCAHGVATLKLTFADALASIVGFLAEHPTEFAVLHLLYATEYDSEQNDYNALLTTLLRSETVAPRLIAFRPDLTVADMRGRILLLSRNDMPACEGYVGGVFSGWPGDSEDFATQKRASIENRRRDFDAASRAKAAVQDISTYSSGHADTKTTAMQRLLAYTQRPRQLTSASQQLFVLNFLSAYAGSLSLSTSYADNAAIQNAALVAYLADHTGPTGFVMMDYAGVDDAQPVSSAQTMGLAAVNAIIDNNFRYLPRAHAAAAPDGFEDVTHLLANPCFEAATKWKNTNGFTATQLGVAEQYDKTFDTYQLVSSAPAGTYRLTCQGFYRHGSLDQARQRHDDGSERLLARLYLGAKTNFATLPSIFSAGLDPVANTLWEANVDLNGEQLYAVDTLEYTLTAPKNLRIGVTKSTAAATDWTTFTNFRLYYRPLPDAVAAPRAEERDEKVYTIGGQQVSRAGHGVFIIGGKKVVK